MLRKAMICLTGLALAGPALASAPAPQMPAQMRGIWMVANAAGKDQCNAYLAELRRPRSDARSKLVGSEVISARGLHSYAEYGEGNFYWAERIVALGKGKWRVHALLGLDGPPEPGAAGKAVLVFNLEGAKLAYRIESIGGAASQGQSARRYFRCAAVPAGFYAG